MVTWIWIGGLIVLLGGFIAGWPTKRGMTRSSPAPATPPASGRDVREPERVPA